MKKVFIFWVLFTSLKAMNNVPSSSKQSTPSETVASCDTDEKALRAIEELARNIRLERLRIEQEARRMEQLYKNAKQHRIFLHTKRQ